MYKRKGLQEFREVFHLQMNEPQGRQIAERVTVPNNLIALPWLTQNHMMPR